MPTPLLDRYRALPGKPGAKAVSLMLDPTMTDNEGRPAGFLSLVTHGANGRYFRAVKAEATDDLPDDAFLLVAKLGRRYPIRKADGSLDESSIGYALAVLPDADDLDDAVRAEAIEAARKAWGEVVHDYGGGVVSGSLARARTILGPLINLGIVSEVAEDGRRIAAKMHTPWDSSDYDERVAIAEAHARIDAAVYAIGDVAHEAIWTAEDPTEAEGLVETALGAFSDHVRAIVRAISARSLAERSASAVRSGSKASIHDDLAESLRRLESKLDRVLPDTSPDNGEEIMNQQTERAVKAAITAAKAEGVTDAEAIAMIAAKAAAAVEANKGAVGGPMQVAINPDTFRDQFGIVISASDAASPETMFAAAFRGVVNKIEEVAKTLEEVKRTISDQGDEPGVLEVLEAHAKTLDALSSTVAKIAGIPKRPASSDDGAGAPKAPRLKWSAPKV